MFKFFFFFFLCLVLTGCLTFDSHLMRSGSSPEMLATHLEMKKNCWYILEVDKYPVLFYNDFQDYTVIIKCRGNYNIYSRTSLDDDFRKNLSESSPSEKCHGKFRYFEYNGKQAFYFDLDTFVRENPGFYAFMLNDGISGFSYCLDRYFKNEISDITKTYLPASQKAFTIKSEKSDYSLFPFSAEDK